MILFLISRMDAPMWAKAAGFGWITLDVLAGALLINEVPAELPDQIRLGGHIPAGTGTWLGGYTATPIPERAGAATAPSA
ncbi:hypothetical protein JOF41_001081 [Saccharothrix coeruleofusca]|uniref:hypothetical protein n=1 Tax=Saccharothrix coeruleofusca TaxID=33919 RepID=UPI001AE3BD0C|nr:hypothetical protein [Saccharothrix coeruleofusca]MBP2334903.1 hypothetical protein [Saccharothrix coeruleofusca]